MDTKIKEKNLKNQIDRINIGCKNYKYAYNSKLPKFLYLGNWIEKESSIFKSEANRKNINNTYPKFKRGEIIKVDFGIGVGQELSYTHFAIVLNEDDHVHTGIVTVLPISSKNGYKRINLGKLLLKALPNTSKYNQVCYGIVTQIKTIGKEKVFDCNFKYICDDTILNKIDEYVIEHLTKKN